MSWWGPKGWGAKPRKSGGPEGWGPRRVGPPKGGAPKGGAPKGGAPKGKGPNPEKVRARSCGGPKLWGPERWEPERWGPKISRFFFPLPPQFFILFSLSFGLFRGILVVFEAPGRSNVHVWSLSCASPGGPVWWGRRGFTRQPESPNVHI